MLVFCNWKCNHQLIESVFVNTHWFIHTSPQHTQRSRSCHDATLDQWRRATETVIDVWTHTVEGKHTHTRELIHITAAVKRRFLLWALLNSEVCACVCVYTRHLWTYMNVYVCVCVCACSLWVKCRRCGLSSLLVTSLCSDDGWR